MSIGVTTLGYGPEAWDQEFYYPMGIEFMAYGCKLWAIGFGRLPAKGFGCRLGLWIPQLYT